MVRYKMVGRDVNSSPTQYRTWITNNNPDLDGSLYTGLKSGNNSFVDVTAYNIPDPYIMDFNLPEPLDWDITYRTLPEAVGNSQLAVIDGYIYLFGGENTDKIYRAPINNPADWANTGATLPTLLSGASYCDVGDGYIYLIGGRVLETVDTIYRALKSNPLVWTDMGSHLPQPIHKSQLAIADGYIYLFGGQGLNHAIDFIHRAPVTNPLNWIDTGSHLPDRLYGSALAIIGGYFVLLGGLFNEDSPTANIYAARVTDPLNWDQRGILPHASAYGQYITIGDRGYLYTAGDIDDTKFFTRILRCIRTSDPFSWQDTEHVLPGQLSQSQVAIIADRIFLFGGNGNSIILASDQKLKYLPSHGPAVTYGDLSRTTWKATSWIDLQKTMGFPPWKCDYDGYGTAPQTPTLWALGRSGFLEPFPTPPSLYKLNKTTLAVMATYTFPNDIRFGLDMVGLDGYLWVLTKDAGSISQLWKINPSDGYVVNRMDFDSNTYRLNTDTVRYLYVANRNNNGVKPSCYVIDARTFTVVDTYVIPSFTGTSYSAVIDVNNRKLFQTSALGYVWVIHKDLNIFQQIDLIGDISNSFIPLAAGGFIWVSAEDDGGNIIKKIDPLAETDVKTINPSQDGPSFNITDLKYNTKYNIVFVANNSSGRIDALDAATNVCTLLATTAPGSYAIGLATFGDFLWVCENDNGTVRYIDLKTNTIQATNSIFSEGIQMLAYTL